MNLVQMYIASEVLGWNGFEPKFIQIMFTKLKWIWNLIFTAPSDCDESGLKFWDGALKFTKAKTLGGCFSQVKFTWHSIPFPHFADKSCDDICFAKIKLVWSKSFG